MWLSAIAGYAVDQKQAQEGIDAISAAQTRAEELRHYRRYGVIVSLWGVVWLAGFSAQQFWPMAANAVWGLGWVGAMGWIVTRPQQPGDAKALATWFVAVAFLTLLLTVLRADEQTASITFALAVSAAYAVMGVWVGRRFFVLAGTILTATCLGQWMAPQWLYGLLALGGGASLIAGGVWLARP